MFLQHAFYSLKYTIVHAMRDKQRDTNAVPLHTGEQTIAWDGSKREGSRATEVTQRHAYFVDLLLSVVIAQVVVAEAAVVLLRSLSQRLLLLAEHVHTHRVVIHALPAQNMTSTTTSTRETTLPTLLLIDKQ